jgi:hypothetical protein
VAIESSKLRQRERHQDQNRARHFDQEVDHPDRPPDTEFPIVSISAFLMSRIP